MVSGKHTFHLNDGALQAIWDAAGLGTVQSAIPPARGAINPCFIVNDAHVIRFDTGFKGIGRFQNEAVAYGRLAASGVPVPEVVVLDYSQRVVPHGYLITSKLPGTPIMDSWAALSVEARQGVARQAGRYLAVIHGHSFGGFFGALRLSPEGAALGAGGLSDGTVEPPVSGAPRSPGFTSWFAFVEDYFRRYAAQAIDLHAIPPETISRIQTVLETYRPQLDRITQSALIHSDYQFENILQQDGVVTGVIDFEWAYAGDPSSDFHIQEKWEEMCPGSVEPFLEGYTCERPLDGEHATRRVIYALLLYLETVVDYANQQDGEALRRTQRDLGDALAWLETPPRF